MKTNLKESKQPHGTTYYCGNCGAEFSRLIETTENIFPEWNKDNMVREIYDGMFYIMRDRDGKEKVYKIKLIEMELQKKE